MTTAQFFEKFDLFAGAPDAVAKMRSLILELAVRGQLTSATSHSSASSDPSANPFPIPQDWQWVALGEIVSFSIGKTPPRGQPQYWDSDDHPWVSIADMRHYETVERTKESVSARAAKEIFGGRFAEQGSILMSFKLTIGKVARAGIRCFHNEAIISLLPPDKTLAEYLFRFLPIFASLQTSNNAIKGRTLNKALLQAIPVPLPPLAEQKRIVAKVDELMALCDQLEAQQQERETKHTALAQATLARFAEAPTPGNLNLLFHSSFSIQPSDLRKTILTLAVQGKLVPQDPNDEPAESLLNRFPPVAKSRDKSHQNASEATQLFLLPESWAWVRLPRVLKKLTDGTHHSPPNGASGDFMYVTAKNIKREGVSLEGITYVSKSVHAEIFSRCDPSFGDVLYIKDGATTGIATINQLDQPFSMLSSVALLKPLGAIFNRYLLWVMRSPFFYAETRSAMKGAAITRVTLSTMAASVLPLPPLAEQKRIVAKVEELMALVDALEAHQAAADQAATHLLDAVVSELAAA